MNTQKGRVVYDRAKNTMTEKDLIRILDSFTPGSTGDQFGKFVYEALEKMTVLTPKMADWIGAFWSYFINQLVSRLEFLKWEDLVKAAVTGQTPGGTPLVVTPPPSEPKLSHMQKIIEWKRGRR